VEIGDPASTADDIYHFKYLSLDPVFTNFVSGSDGLGPARASETTTGGTDWGLILYDVSSTLSGSLDYVQLGTLLRDNGPNDASVIYFAVGPAFDTAALPTTGTARYDGGTRGYYVNSAGVLYFTGSDITMTANFASSNITGSTSNFRFTNENAVSVAQPDNIAFTFTANISSNSNAQFFGIGGVPGSNMGGLVYGRFMGEVSGPPTEAGLAYSFENPSTGAFMAGAGALNQTQ
jgi:hypothetical protein